MYLLYRILTAAGMLFLIPYYAWRGWRRGEPAETLRQRLGRLPREILERAAPASDGEKQRPVIWIHAVSVGEVLAAACLVENLKQRYTSCRVFISTTTETGQRLALERLPRAEGVFYFPLDWMVAVRRALRAIRPALIIVMETEIWPNFLREAEQRGIPVIFANARVSERSFAQYRRWKFLVESLFAQAMKGATLFLAQTPEDARRLVAMGAPEEIVKVTGNLKYDAEPPASGAFTAWLEEQFSRQERWPVLVAGSVVAEEEEAVLAAYDIVQRRWRRALLILAPRKPERFPAAAAIAAEDGWNVVLRSRLDLSVALEENAEVLLVDSIGELAGLYRLADAAFVGGSLVPSGGHNILEPAWFGRPPVFGRSMENFQDMAAQFLTARAGIQVSSGEHLGRVWVQLIENDAVREQMGRAARSLSERNRGATQRSLAQIAAVLEAEGCPA